MKAKIKNLYSRLLSSLYLKKKWDGEVVLPSKPYRLVLFSHFDANGNVHDYVIAYLKHLTYENNCLIIFISTSHRLNEKSIDAIKPYCYRILLRKNIGLDFGSWRMGYDQYKKLLDKAESLLLLNDSCFGPLYSLQPVLEEFNFHKNSISGITFNWEVSPHIQSYFLYIPREIFISDFFINFMKNIIYSSNKDKIIYNYEIGLSSLALKAGYKLNTWVKNELLEEKCVGVDSKKNLTIWYCHLLLKEKFSPFVKKAVFVNSNNLIQEEYKEVVKYLDVEHPAYTIMINHYLYTPGK
jgi:lipopolysaccharide biosynthesis protein